MTAGRDDAPPNPRAADRFERYVVPEIEVLLRVATSLTGATADAEDLVQDTLLRAYGAIERFDGRHPRAWLLTILRNTHINRHRRQRPELLRDGERVADAVAPNRTDATVDAAFGAEVEAALASLDTKFRSVVELVDIDGLSYAEAAATLDVPDGTVMSRLHRARTRIRKQLLRRGVAPKAPMRPPPEQRGGSR